jgi:hypothetical protein
MNYATPTLIVMLLGLALPCAAPAQLVCERGQAVCGARCYNPGTGFTCTNGILCGPGQAVCGNSCYSSGLGETCKTGVACPSGFEACGASCFNPAAGETCNQTVTQTHDQGIITYSPPGR